MRTTAIIKMQRNEEIPSKTAKFNFHFISSRSLKPTELQWFLLYKSFWPLTQWGVVVTGDD